MTIHRRLFFVMSLVLATLNCLPPSARAETFPEVRDYFDGLRAWELEQKELALAIWSNAATWGDFRAMERLSELYERGELVDSSPEFALFWHLVADRLDQSDGGKLTASIRVQVDSVRAAEIEAAAKAWNPQSLPLSLAVEALTELADDPTRKGREQELFAALFERNLAAFDKLLRSGVSPDVRMQGSPLLAHAIALRAKDFIESLLSAGVNPDFVVAGGTTPLHLAAGIGDLEIVSLLRDHVAYASLEDENGASAAQLAHAMGHPQIATFIHERETVELAELTTYLDKSGYLVGDFADTTSRYRAILMYQQARDDLPDTGFLSKETFDAIRSDRLAGKKHAYLYFLRWTKGGTFWVKSNAGSFSGVLEARAAAMAICKDEGGEDCKFNYAPSGGCLAAANGESGRYRVSALSLTDTEATLDAMLQCREDHSEGCQVWTSLCKK